MGCRKLDISQNYESVLTVVGKSLTTEKLQVEHFWETKKMGVNYYPFGSIMPGRSYNSGDYRYGFNSMEKDDEIKNITGSSYDFGARMYDSRLGRWFSVDPQFKKQPGWSTYKAFLDNPIFFVDPEGETEYGTIKVHNEKTGKTKTYVYTAPNIMTDGQKHELTTMGKGYAYENRYYDYETTITYTVHKDGSMTKTESQKIIYKEDGTYKDADYVWSDGESYGHTKLDVADYLFKKQRKDGANLNSKHKNHTDSHGPGGKPTESSESDWDPFSTDYEEFNQGDTMKNDYFWRETWMDEVLVKDSNSNNGVYEVRGVDPDDYKEVKSESLPSKKGN